MFNIVLNDLILAFASERKRREKICENGNFCASQLLSNDDDGELPVAQPFNRPECVRRRHEKLLN